VKQKKRKIKSYDTELHKEIQRSTEKNNSVKLCETTNNKNYDKKQHKKHKTTGENSLQHFVKQFEILTLNK